MYSNDFIFIVIRLYNSRSIHGLSINSILQIARISRSTLFDWIKNYSNDSTYYDFCSNIVSNAQPLKRQFNRSFYPKKVNGACLQYIISTVLDNKIINANKICKCVKQKFGIVISKNYLYKILKDNNISYKVSQKSSYPHDSKTFEQQKQQLINNVNRVNHKLNYTDETAIYFGIKPNYGWSKKGTRCIVDQQSSYSNKSTKRLSLVMTMTSDKIIIHRLIRGTYNAKHFKGYMINTIPKMNDTIPFMDNARAHTAKAVTKYLEAI